jgi:flagellin
LSAFASDAAVSTNDIALYDTEFQDLQDNMSSLLTEEFNGVPLFANGGASIAVVTSENGTQTTSITKANLDAVENTVTAIAGITTTVLATAASATLETAIQDVAELRAENGAEQSRLAFAQDILALNRENLEAANSRVMDADIAEESTNFVRLSIIQEAGLAMLAQANTSTESLIRLLE